MAAQVRSEEKRQPHFKEKSRVEAANFTTPGPVSLATYGSGKPDKSVYDAEQSRIKAEIDTVQAKFNAVKDKIALTNKDGPNADRRKALRAELDGLRDQQSVGKNSRGKTLDQVKSLQDSVAKKVKDLHTAKAKYPYKSVADVEVYVKNLEKQIDSGNMKLAEEKRALQEISQAKRARKAIEGFQKDQQSIDEDREKIEELRKLLDDPQLKAASERFEEIKSELDEIKKEGDEAYASRNKLFDERNALRDELDNLYATKKESAQNYKDASDKHWAKISEDRARRAERIRQQKAAEEAEKRAATAERLREEASIPAFQSQIEDCQTLVDYFSAKLNGTTSGDVPAPKLSNGRSEVAGVPQLEIRQVNNDPQEGLIARKKKGGEDDYFVATKGKKKSVRLPNAAPQSSNANTQLNLPLGILTALLEMSIPAPSSNGDVPRVITDIKTKKSWFEANQDRITSEKVEKAEKEIQRLVGKTPESASLDGVIEIPEEPTPTPVVSTEQSDPIPGDDLERKLEDAKLSDAQT